MHDFILSRLKDQANYFFSCDMCECEKKYMNDNGYDVDDILKSYWDVIEKEYENINYDEQNMFYEFILTTGSKRLDVVQKIFDHVAKKENKPNLFHSIINYFPDIKVDYENMDINILFKTKNKSYFLRHLDDYPEKHGEFISYALDHHDYEALELYVTSFHYNEELLLSFFREERFVDPSKILRSKNLMDILKTNNVKMSCSRTDTLIKDDLYDVYLSGVFKSPLIFNDIFEATNGNIDDIINILEHRTDLERVFIKPKYVDRYDIWNYVNTRYENVIFYVDPCTPVNLDKILQLHDAYPSRVRLPSGIDVMTWCDGQDLETAKKMIETLTDENGWVKFYCNELDDYQIEKIFTGTFYERVAKLIDFFNYFKISLHICFHKKHNLDAVKELLQSHKNIDFTWYDD